jgi:RND family efflux transporter MFP subunit
MRAQAWRGAGLGLLLLAPLGCGSKSETPLEAKSAPKPVPVTLAASTRRLVERHVDIVGTLKGWEEVTIGSKRAGRVVKVFHDMGDVVKPDDPLIELETVDAQLSILRAERSLASELAKLGLAELPAQEFDVHKVPAVVQAKVSLERARRELNRQRALSQRGAGTFQDYQNAETDEQAATAALENAIVTARSTLANAQASKVAWDVAKQTLTDTMVRVPIPTLIPKGYNGPIEYAVSRRVVSEGQMLKEGEAVADLVIRSALRLWANVPERYSSDIEFGQVVKLSVTSRPGEVFEGRVARINPAVDPISRTFQVEALVPNPKNLLRPGGFAKASIVTQTNSEAIIVPLEAIVHFAGVTKLFVVEAGKAHSVPVETGLEGADWVEVLGALSPGAQVVTSGQSQLAEETPIVVRKAKEAKVGSSRGGEERGEENRTIADPVPRDHK